jgi:hypothetical protein
MGRRASNVVAFNDPAVRKTVREGRGVPQKEWRVGDVSGLVLITQPSGTGVFYFFYRNSLGKNRKLRMGEYVLKFKTINFLIWGSQVQILSGSPLSLVESIN